nr:MAG TPA: hypothetical protein [Caudoviricetes sp.]
MEKIFYITFNIYSIYGKIRYVSVFIHVIKFLWRKRTYG